MNPIPAVWKLFLEIITILKGAGMSDAELLEVEQDYLDYLEIEEK